MLIEMTVPKPPSRAKWSQSAGTWQPGRLSPQASYQQHPPSATVTPVQGVNGVRTLSPPASATAWPVSKATGTPAGPLCTLSLQVRPRASRTPELLSSQEKSLSPGLQLVLGEQGSIIKRDRVRKESSDKQQRPEGFSMSFSTHES